MYSQNKKFYFIGEVEGACLLANAEEKFLRPRREETRGPSLQEAWLPSHALLPSLLPQLLQHFSTSLLKKFHPMHKNSMSTFTGLVRLFSRRTTRVLSSKNVANTFQSSCRARSIFAATTRGASQNLIYAIPCACTKVCACEVHKYTQADSELMSFLKQEIQHERDAASKVSPSTLFETKVDGTQVSMEREHNGERIVLSFELNENINQDEGGADVDAGSDDEEAFLGKIVSYPSFTVEITKKTGHTLKFYCEFNSDLGEDYLSDGEVEGERAAPEMVHIINVSVMDSPNRDKEKTIYCAETENMDSNLYVMLLNMLAERGVDNDFCQWLLDYSTSLEQQHYIKFLEDLQGFVKLQ